MKFKRKCDNCECECEFVKEDIFRDYYEDTEFEDTSTNNFKRVFDANMGLYKNVPKNPKFNFKIYCNFVKCPICNHKIKLVELNRVKCKLI